ncbi:MAG: sensor domain-containing diguanylate cyclase [Pseudomonadota bacterium]
MLTASLSATGATGDVPEPSAATSSGLALGQALGTDTLLLTVIALTMVAIVALAGVVRARQETRTAARMARNHAKSMNEMLRTIRMAESIADIGVWQYDPRCGEQQWSDGMRRLFGIEHHDEFVAGDAETLLYANDIDLVGNVMQHAHERHPFTLHYDIHGYDGAPRSISVQACNLFGAGGAVARIVAVVRDVTDQMSRERALEQSRRVAVREADKARKLAETDPLTGLANRRRVMTDLDRMILSSRQLLRPLTLVVFDIDKFKAVNDTHGHVEGDKVLRRVAQIAQNQARDGDLVGRVGGEEFVWIVPGATSDQAELMAQRLREAVEQGSPVGDVPAVTISLGLAQLHSHDTSISIFSRADVALYAAKNSGRNRVEVAV